MDTADNSSPTSGPLDSAGTGQIDAEGAESSTRVLRKFRSVFNAVKTHFRQVERQAGVGGAQLWALSVIHDTAGISVSALAAALDVHQATASNLVRSLMTQDLVTSTRSERDKRAVHLWISQLGQAVLHRAPGPFTGVLPAALAALNPETLHRLDTDLGKLLQLLEVDKSAEGIPLAEI